MNNIDLIEINEAFAAQTLACAKELGIDINKLNIWGGAISIGHPLGASGNSIMRIRIRMFINEGVFEKVLVVVYRIDVVVYNLW